MDKIRQLQDMINESNLNRLFGAVPASLPRVIFRTSGVQTDSTNKSTATHRSKL